jgi:hypothetical protein
MMARAALNLVIAGYCLRLVRRERAVGAKAAVGATVADGQTIIALRRARSQDRKLPARRC